jgi:glycosyltransferase involved in cell wall biosynthesis
MSTERQTPAKSWPKVLISRQAGRSLSRNGLATRLPLVRYRNAIRSVQSASNRIGLAGRYPQTGSEAGLKVALMGRSLRGRFSGVVRYTDQLARAVGSVLGDDLIVFLTRAPDGLGDLRVRRVRAPFPTPNEYARAFWEQTIVPIQVARLRPDVYHSPNYILPLAIGCPTVVTIHDLFYRDGSLHRLRSHLYLSLLADIAIRKATRVICVSAYTRDRLLERFPDAVDRVRVVGEGVDPSFRPPSNAAMAGLRERLDFSHPYVLFVGTIEPRKNLARLIKAFERAVTRARLPHHLVIAGAWGWKDGPVRAALEASSIRDRIHMVGYLAEEDLPTAYGGADVFAYPSEGEGFGLPPLEAMACGTAVLTSSTTSLPEVVGDAALMVDPRDELDLAEGLERLLCDPEKRRKLSQSGLKRAAEFSWARVAEQTMAVYAEAIA